jgi:hypothetical protein
LFCRQKTARIHFLIRLAISESISDSANDHRDFKQRMGDLGLSGRDAGLGKIWAEILQRGIAHQPDHDAR